MVGRRKGTDWIPAYAESTPQSAPRMGIKCSGVLKRNTRGGMTELRRKGGELTTLGWNYQLTLYRLRNIDGWVDGVQCGSHGVCVVTARGVQQGVDGRVIRRCGAVDGAGTSPCVLA